MTLYVNKAAADGGNGSKEKPFNTIQQAAEIAVAGDEVIVAPGIYREWVNPKNGGAEGKQIVYKSEKPLGNPVSNHLPSGSLTFPTLHLKTVYPISESFSLMLF